MLLDAVVDALFECLMFLELCDDDTVNPDDAVRVMGDVAYIFGEMPADDRAKLAELAKQRAAVEPNGVRREFLESLPEAFGLVDEPNELC